MQFKGFIESLSLFSFSFYVRRGLFFVVYIMHSSYQSFTFLYRLQGWINSVGRAGPSPLRVIFRTRRLCLWSVLREEEKTRQEMTFFFLIFSSSFKFEAQLTLISIPGCWWLSADKEELIFFFSSIHRIFSSVFFTDFVNKYLDSTKKNIHTAQKSTRVLCGSYLTTGATQKLSLRFSCFKS